jgi:hypothetical protein
LVAEVSTLLEILGQVRARRPVGASASGVSTLLEILGGTPLHKAAIYTTCVFQPFLRFWRERVTGL